MPNVVDLMLFAHARGTLERVLADRGISFFLARAGRGPARLDNRRIAWVVEASQRRARRRARAGDVVRTRRVLRRELIRRLTHQLLSCGL